MKLVLWALALALSGPGARADVFTSTACEANYELIQGPMLGPSSRCEIRRAHIDAVNPSIRHEGSGRSEAEATHGVLRARASTSSTEGEAYALGAAWVESSFAVNPTDGSRVGEAAYVILGSHRIDWGAERSVTEPRTDGDGQFEWSTAFTSLQYDYRFSTFMGPAVEGSFREEATSSVGGGHDAPGASASFSTLTGPFRVPILLGEGVSIGMSLVAQVYSVGSGVANVDAFHAAYWGGITDVVDAAGRSIGVNVVSAPGADWARSQVPGVAAPVPEPSAGLLVALGLAVLVASRGLRRPRFTP